jgi:hypothetical protein
VGDTCAGGQRNHERVHLHDFPRRGRSGDPIWAAAASKGRFRRVLEGIGSQTREEFKQKRERRTRSVGEREMERKSRETDRQ